MKKIALFIFSLLLLFAMSVQAQNVRVDKNILVSKHFANSGADSVSDISVTYKANAADFPELRNQFPDSILIRYFATDSCAGKFYFKARYAGKSYATGLGDSIGNIATTTAIATAADVIGYASYQDMDELRVIYRANATANGVLTTHKVSAVLSFFYKKP